MNPPQRALAAAAHAVARGSGYLWAFPNTLIGLMLATLALRGGRAAMVGGVLEVTGRGVRAFLRRFPVRGEVLALTLGHVVLSSDETTMTEVRDHELAHVRQYALWGPLFLPAYAVASLIAFAGGRDPYRENAFERNAFRRGSSRKVVLLHQAGAGPPESPARRGVARKWRPPKRLRRSVG